MINQKISYFQLPTYSNHFNQNRARFFKWLLVFLMILVVFHAIMDFSAERLTILTLLLYIIGFLHQCVAYVLLHHKRINSAIFVFLVSWWGAYAMLALILENHLLIGTVSIVITSLLITGIIGTPKQTVLFSILIILTNIFFTILLNTGQLNPTYTDFTFTSSTSNIFTGLYLLWSVFVFFTNRMVQRSFNQLTLVNHELNIMLENVPMGIWYVDLSGRILRANQYAQNLFGYTIEELKMKKFVDLTHPDDKQRGQQSLQDLLDQKITSFRDEKRFITKSGETLDVIIHVSPISDLKNQPTHFVAAIENVTEKKQFGAILEANQAKYNALYENAPIMIHAISDAGDLLEVNDVWLKTFEYSKEEVIGKQASSFLTEESRTYANEFCYPKFKRTGFLDQVEFMFIKKSGDVMNCLLTAVWINEQFNDEPAYGLAFLMDITDLRNTEAILHQTQRLDSVGTLAGGIAHDFNNLLTGALTQNALLLRTFEEDSWAYKRAKKTKVSLDRAAELTNQLLTYVGKGKSDFTYFDLSHLLKRSRSFLSVGTPDHVKLSFEIDTKPLPIFADRSQIQQILQNLVLNSIEAFDPDQAGEVFVSTQSKLFTAEDFKGYQNHQLLNETEYALIHVQDNGRGMDDYTLNQVFDPFFSTKETGHGLGMAGVLGIVKQHRGGIRIQSSPMTGTAVSIILPITTEAEFKNIDTKPVPILPSSINATVLIAEDQIEAQEAAKEALQSFGISVYIASDGQQAVQLYETHHSKIDLVLLDLNMPNQNGVETLKQIGQLNGRPKTILTSGNPDPYQEQLSQLHYDAFLQKPFDAYKLIQCIYEVLQS